MNHLSDDRDERRSVVGKFAKFKEGLLDRIHYFAIALGLVYFACMFVGPGVSGRFSWDHYQDVWHYWMPLNVGILAFTSSVIALNIAKYNANRQRERQFIAARAFLPHALSALIDYCRSSAEVWQEAWERTGSGSPLVTLRAGLSSSAPDLPSSYESIFSRCIEHADPAVANYLAQIIVKLQVHHSRLKMMEGAYRPHRAISTTRSYVRGNLYALGEIYALISKLFGFARGIEPFDGSEPTWENFKNAYSILRLHPERFDDLEKFTKRRLDKEDNDAPSKKKPRE